MVVTVKKSIWKQNKVVALRVKLIPMCVEFIYIYIYVFAVVTNKRLYRIRNNV